MKNSQTVFKNKCLKTFLPILHLYFLPSVFKNQFLFLSQEILFLTIEFETFNSCIKDVYLDKLQDILIGFFKKIINQEIGHRTFPLNKGCLSNTTS